MLLPVAGKPDWFWVDEQSVHPILGAPGMKFEGKRIKVHRSHLPIIPTDEAIRLLHKHENRPETWAARDVRTKALGFTLRTTQQQAIDFIQQRRGTLLGDDLRLGKTLSAIMSHDPTDGPFVVVAPLLARGVWLGWLKRVFPDAAVGVLTGRKFDRSLVEGKDVIFVHYDIIKNWQVGMTIGTLVFDEAHALTNHKSLRSSAAVFLASRAKRVIAMTGTPIWNMPPDLWNVLGIVAPGGFGSYFEFCYRYGLPIETAYGTQFTGISHEAELRARVSEFMLRRRWVDVTDDVPPITRNVVVATVDQKTRNKLDILAAKLHAERTNTAANLAHYRSQLGAIKLAATVTQAEKQLDAGEPTVIWTWHKELANQLKEKLGSRAFLIHGDIAPHKRDLEIEAWRQACRDNLPSALIATMSVANAAVDFSEARMPIFAEIDWTPAVIGQAEMRTFKMGQAMNVTFIVADHIIDQRIIRALVGKLGAANPLGVGAAIDAIEALRSAVFGVEEVADMDRLLEDLIAEAA